MDPRHLPVDERLTGCCVFCGGPPDTRDHVPSKMLLDEPLPPYLPVVEACADCNQSFSLDEEYLACLLDCVLSGTASLEGLQRGKVRRALSHNPKLARMLEDCKRMDETGRLVWQPEDDRVRNTVLKLARGHVAYELSLPQLDAPVQVAVAPFVTMSEEQRASFENASGGTVQGWPEVGSRAFHRACGVAPDPLEQIDAWIIVQPGRYRYCVEETGGVLVQMVLSEYLTCRVVWD